METNEDVEVRVLLEEEAWNLFRAKIGDQVLTSSVIEPIAKDVAKECGGLPLAIVTVGRALRNAFNISECENALVELRASNDNIDNMDKVVFSRLLLSYKKLRDDTSRSCFLFCALYPEGHLIDTTELIAYWMWEGLLGGVVRTSESKRKGKVILNELKYACLLESADHDGVEYVKLHDLIRDMAIKIIRTSHRCIVNAGSQLTKPPGPDEWGDDVRRVSLMRNDLKFINFSPMCSKLTSLLLQYNSFVDGIGNDFFDNMQGLKVLDLSYTGISALPESVSNLENLCALLLSHCWYLSAVPTLAKLSKLMVLDLSSCGLLQELPHGMEHLNNLRHLDISSTGIEFLPFRLVSKFTLLEDLITDCSGVIWVSQRVKGIEGGACIEELISSPKLSTLSINFWNIKVFNEYAASKHWCQLNEYKFTVGQRVSAVRSSLEKKSLVLNGGFPMDKSAALILRTTVELRIAYVHSITLLSTHLPDVMNLKRVVIMFCRRMSCILDCEENNLPMLESLDLINLHDSKMICKASVRSGTLVSLKFINVEGCPQLKSLFSRQLTLELKNLEEISLRKCGHMEEVIEMENENVDDEAKSRASKVIFPNLKRLKLYNMYTLKSIYNGDVVCNSLCSIEVHSCHDLKRLPLGLFAVEPNQPDSSPPARKEIKGSVDWWESLNWDQPAAKQLLQPYFVAMEIDLLPNSTGSSRIDKFQPSSSNA